MKQDTKTSFQEMKKTMFFCKTSVVYPFVNFEKKIKNLKNLSYFLCGTFWRDVTVVVQVRNIGFL